MQSKTTMSHHLTPIRMAINKNSQDREQRLVLVRVWRKGNPFTLLVGMCMLTALMDNSLETDHNLKIELPYNPAVPLGSYPKEIKSMSERRLHFPVYDSSIHITKKWK